MPAAINMNAITKDDVLARLHRLPSMPAIIQQVIASFNNSNLDSAKLAQVIAQDQGLSAKILRIANSPFYGLPRTISSLQDAVVVMGFNSIRSLALSAGVVHAFPVIQGSLFDRRVHWTRSFRVAGYTQALANSLKQDQKMAFTAGMFYDIGQLVLDVCIPAQFASLLEEQENSGLSLIEIEQSRLGFDHALIGAEMAQRWNFPPEIEHAIRYWRTPEQEPFEPIAGLVYVAALLENGLSGDALMSHLPGTLCDRLQLSWQRIVAVMPESDQLDAGAHLMLAT